MKKKNGHFSIYLGPVLHSYLFKMCFIVQIATITGKTNLKLADGPFVLSVPTDFPASNYTDGDGDSLDVVAEPEDCPVLELLWDDLFDVADEKGPSCRGDFVSLNVVGVRIFKKVIFTINSTS